MIKDFKRVYLKLINLMAFGVIDKLNNELTTYSHNNLKLVDSTLKLLRTIEQHRELNKLLQEQVDIKDSLIDKYKSKIAKLELKNYESKCDLANDWLSRNDPNSNSYKQFRIYPEGQN